MDMERLNLKKLNEGEVKKQYQVTISNKLAVLENLGNNGDINRVWDTIREDTKISAKDCLNHCELKHHKPWFNEECSKLVDQRKQAKLHWLQNPSKVMKVT
jgi:hypothetical protein